MRTVAVVGAAGSTGAKACRAAVERGLRVIAVDRDFPGRPDAPGVEHRRADVLADDLGPALSGAEAVISALGLPFTPSNALRPPPLYPDGTRNVIEAMRRLRLRRLALISAAFVAPQPTLPLWFGLTVVPALHAILDQMRAMERLVAAQDDLDWTIVRPGWLLDRPAGGALVAQDGTLADGAFRCREGDLARFLVEVAVTGAWTGQRPAVGAADEALYESPLALGLALGGMLRSALP